MKPTKPVPVPCNAPLNSGPCVRPSFKSYTDVDGVQRGFCGSPGHAVLTLVRYPEEGVAFPGLVGSHRLRAVPMTRIRRWYWQVIRHHEAHPGWYPECPEPDCARWRE